MGCTRRTMRSHVLVRMVLYLYLQVPAHGLGEAQSEHESDIAIRREIDTWFRVSEPIKRQNHHENFGDFVG